MLVIKKIPSSYTERGERVVCCKEGFQGEKAWKVFVVRKLHLSYEERRIVGVCQKGISLLLQV